jgi:hypothetical protein
MPRRIPSDTDSRTEQIIDRVKQGIVCGFGIAVGNLVLNRVTRAQVEVAEYGRRTLGPRIATVVIAQSDSQCQIASCLPGILDEKAKGPRCSIPTPQLLGSGLRVVIDAILIGGRVLR